MLSANLNEIYFYSLRNSMKIKTLTLAITTAMFLGAGSMPAFSADTSKKTTAKAPAKSASKSSGKSVAKTKSAAVAGVAGIAGVSSIAAVAAMSQTPELDALNTSCAHELTQGSLPKAEEACNKALALAEKTAPNSKPLATAISHQASLFAAQDKPQEAEAAYKKALATYESALNPNHLAVATALSQLAGFYFLHERFAEAAPLYSRALAIDERALGSDHAEVAKDLYNLSTVNSLLGNYKDAEAQSQRCLKIREKVLAANDPAIVRTLDRMGENFALQGRMDEALRAYGLAVTASEKAHGADADETQICKTKLASVQSQLNGTSSTP
ncbi:MAG TPA: tetratricopeptide repeat protein [bacterium]|nr:tetratricopeptide repeat protein [bacterium]